jgi:5'-AMP-activated protein kinase, catalytic alpha subunit
LNTDPDKRYGIDEIRCHPWFKQQKDRRPEGIFPGLEPMPVDNKMYQVMLDEFSYDPDYSVKCIEANRHNQITATYHLLCKKMLRQEKNLDDANTANLVGSLDRGHKPTRNEM